MKKVFVAIAVVAAAYGVSISAKVRTMGLGFVAPQVNDKGAIDTPHLGEIVYDTTLSQYFGYDGATPWAPLSGAASSIPTGAILPFAGVSAPAGFALCDGTSQLRTDPQFSALFGVISTSFGAADGTHFNLPDLRGRFLRGTDGGTGRDPDSGSRTAMNGGGNTGNNVGSVQADDFRSHSHLQNRSTGAGGSNGYSSLAATGSTPTYLNTGSAGGNETRPLNAYVNYIIKL